MVSTKLVSKDVAEIESKLKTFKGDMVRIEFLENCLRQLVPNDAKRFCHLKLGEMYAVRLMYGLAAKNMGAAAECATTYKDKIDFYMLEMVYLIKINDFLLLDKAFKKAILCGNEHEKEIVKGFLKHEIISQAQEYEKKNKRSSAAMLYERLMEMSIINDQERKELMAKLATLNSGLGKIKEAMRYEQMMKRPIEPRRSNDADGNVRRVSFQDLGIDSV